MDTSPDTPHRRAWDAIPWVLAGTATEEDTRLVQEHLPHCADCRSEWQFQTQLQAGLKAGVPSVCPAPDAALARLMHRVDEASSVPESPSMGRPAGMPASTGRWLVAAVLVQAVALGVSGLGWWQASSADFQTLTDASARVTAPSLRVVPAPDFDFAALQALLAKHQLVIVGTDAGGLYLSLGPADGNLTTAQAALPALRAHPGLRLVEATATAVER
jgi:hypothetical protein